VRLVEITEMPALKDPKGTSIQQDETPDIYFNKLLPAFNV